MTNNKTPLSTFQSKSKNFNTSKGPRNKGDQGAGGGR